ncbi:LPS-assembly protein LptD [Mucilaginibacter sp. RS28]|uniref:LPS-assembly protein LptD n=1 Tax=Mucilaginibacter straminoryzae TaxID=2932774 RepID=A0A9X1X1S9_9SPHI|nr:putative LPS assembly protein LptD [Mucilaginibacter straminoryzae]MCJ8209647.1 LPS-assembly protein LptD [Mucilaginibacter straminoryzae]
MLLAFTNNVIAQQLLGSDTTIRRDSLPKVTRSGGKIKARSTKPTKAAKDTSKNKGGLNSIVRATAQDSSYTDQEHKISYLYGRARVTYEDFELDADYIRLDEKNKTVFASGRIDPKTHRYTGRPILKQKSDKPTMADSLYYNYETKKGKVFNPSSQQDANYLSGGMAKKLNENEVAYRNVLYSTCDLPYPDTHFGIVITKGIAEKNQIIAGPAYLEILNVPIPIGIPFGFFPKPESRASGVILPTFGEDAKLGFFLREFGYYLALNDYIDLTTTGTIYSKGSFEVRERSVYQKRYNYTGSVALSFTSMNYGNPGDPARKNFNIAWSHAQDPNAHPGSVFSASVNAGTSSYYQSSPGQQSYSLQQLTQNTLQSSVSYQRTWPNSPFNLSVNLQHSQDITNRTVNLQLPTFSFNMASLSPFDSKDRVGEQKWYQKITVSYTSQGTNTLNNIKESVLFNKDTLLRYLRSGFKQTIPVSMNLTLLKYLQFSSSATYNEYWNFQTTRKYYDRTNVNNPTQPVTEVVPGFRRAGDYTFGANFTTKLYGTTNFKGKIKAIRHVMTPSIGFSYAPDFTTLDRTYNKIIVTESTVPYPYYAQRYSIFDNTAVGGPTGRRSGAITFSLDNSVEAKVRAKSTDSSQADKKISILQSLTFNGSYNLAADSFRLSQIAFNGHTAVFNQKVNINFGGNFNPYSVRFRDSIANNAVVRTARLIDRYSWQDGKLPQLTNFYASADISLNSKSKTGKSYNPYSTVTTARASGMSPQEAERLSMINQDQSAFVDFNIPWNVNLSYTFNYSLVNNGLSTTIGNTVQARGDVSVTPKWKITYYSDIDVRKQKMTTMQLGIYRDLHCWDLSVQWIPFGYLKMYSVMLRVKSTILQDLKLSKRSDFTNNTYYNPN